MGRFLGHLEKGDAERAQNDLNLSLLTSKLEIERDLEYAKFVRASVKLESERALEGPSSHDSTLIRAGFLFSIVESNCSRVKSQYSYSPKRYPKAFPSHYLSHADAVKSLSNIDVNCQTASIGKAEAYAYSLIEVQNIQHKFYALQFANELVQKYPNNPESYRIRSRVNRVWGFVEQAVLDEKKLQELLASNNK